MGQTRKQYPYHVLLSVQTDVLLQVPCEATVNIPTLNVNIELRETLLSIQLRNSKKKVVRPKTFFLMQYKEDTVNLKLTVKKDRGKNPKRITYR